jgi:hypothetical protein
LESLLPICLFIFVVLLSFLSVRLDRGGPSQRDRPDRGGL